MNQYKSTTSSTGYPSNSFLFESNLQTKGFSVFTRIESVQKSFGELQIPVANENKNNLINSFSLGISKYLSKNKYFWMDLGVMGYLYSINPELMDYYGKSPVSAEVFLRIIPPRMYVNKSIDQDMPGMKM